MGSHPISAMSPQIQGATDEASSYQPPLYPLCGSPCMCLHTQVRKACQIPPNNCLLRPVNICVQDLNPCLTSCPVLQTPILPGGAVLDLFCWVCKTDSSFCITQDPWAPGGQCILPTVKGQNNNLQTGECLQ